MNKRYRLRKNYEFNHVYRKGKSCASREMIIYCVKTGGEKIRVGFSAGKKVGKSVQRNHAKRLMREAFRGMFANIEKGNNYIVCARPAILESDFCAISKSLKYMLKKCGKLSS